MRKAAWLLIPLGAIVLIAILMGRRTRPFLSPEEKRRDYSY